MKKYISAALLAAVSIFSASAAELEYFMIVNTVDGNSVEFAFDFKPVATFDGDDMIIKDEDHEDGIRYNMADVKNITLRTPTTAVEDIISDKAMVKVAVTKEAVSISGLEEGAVVSIYTVSGMAVASASASALGEVVIPVGSLASGVYVASMPGSSFKFTR